MKGFFPEYQTDIEHILRESPLSEDKLLSIMDEIYTAYSLAEVTERELKRNRESYSIHYKRKADEYEAKAKAWDKYKAHMESHIAGEINEEEFVSDLKSDYFESGESYA